jgi:hypothetical protein
MKFLVRGKDSFLEAKVEGGELKATHIKVDPKELVHFGSDIVERAGFDSTEYITVEYLDKMRNFGADYIFVSQNEEEVDFAQSGKRLIAVTVYKKR